MIIPRVQPFKTTAKGLVACWPAFEGAGPVLHDVSGYGNDGGPGVFPTWADYQPAASPASGLALLFDGASNYISAPSSSALNFTAALSVCAHVKFSSVASTQRLIAKWTGSGMGWLLQVTGGGTVTCYVDAPGQGIVGASGGIVDAVADHWLVGTYDGALIRAYLDGVLVGTQLQSGAISTNTHQLNIGTDETETLFFFDGYFLEGRVYNRALAASEVWDIRAGNG